jgi:hypothetical protein
MWRMPLLLVAEFARIPRTTTGARALNPGEFSYNAVMNTLDLFTLAVAVGLLILAAAITLFARRSPLGDSPWYWVCMFGVAAAVALFVMDGKYARRQDHLENEYRYGTRTAAPTPESDSSRAPSPEPQAPTRLISLWPLRIAAIATTLISLVMLIRGSRASRGSQSSTNPVDSDTQCPPRRQKSDP